MSRRASDLLPLAGLALAVGLYYWSSLPLAAIGAILFIGLAAWRLDFAVLVPVLAMPFYLPVDANPLPPRPIGGWAFSLLESTVLGCLAGFVVRSAWAWGKRTGNTLHPVPPLSRLSRRFAAFAIHGPPLLFVVAAVTATAAAAYSVVAFRELRTTIVEPLVFYVMLMAVVRREEQVWRLGWALVLLGLALSLYAFYHYIFVGIVEATEGVRRVLAIYHSPNQLALLVGRLAPVALALALWPTLGRRPRALAALAALAMLLCLGLTYSRGAWLGVAAAVLLIAVLRGKRLLLGTAGLLGAGLLALLPAVGLERLLSWSTTSRRLLVWQAGLALGRDHPLLGVGPDNFLYHYRDRGYMLPAAWPEPDLSHPHNLLLDHWLRLGLLGVAAAVWLQVVFWRTGLALFHRLAGRPLQAMVVGLLASMLDFLVHGAIDNSVFLPDLALVFWLTYGLIQAIDNASEATCAS